MTDEEADDLVHGAAVTIEHVLADLETRTGRPVSELRIDRLEVTSLMSHGRKYLRQVRIDCGPVAGFGWSSLRGGK